MKVDITESTFNEAISKNKLELANWLLDQGCPTNSMCYLKATDVDTLSWLMTRGIVVNKGCLADVLNITGDLQIVDWFLSQNVVVNSEAINSCIKNNRGEIFKIFTRNNDVKLTVDNFKSAVIAEDTGVLDFLKSKRCSFDESVIETAMKYKKKNSLKWLVINDYM